MIKRITPQHLLGFALVTILLKRPVFHCLPRPCILPAVGQAWPLQPLLPSLHTPHAPRCHPCNQPFYTHVAGFSGVFAMAWSFLFFWNAFLCLTNC